MQVYASLSKEARQARFIATGVQYPDVVTLDVPIAALSVTAREQLATFASLTEGVGTALAFPPVAHATPPRYVSQAWPLPLLPETPAAWESVISQYVTDYQEWRRTQVAEARAHLRQGNWLAANSITTAFQDVDGYDALVAERAAYHRGVAERESAAKAEADQRAARERQEREAREADAAARKAAAEADKVAWVAAHGSDHLRQAVEAGYDCQRLYVTERVALEYPGYVVDWRDNARWRSRSCPSAEALAEALRVEGEVVWLTVPPHEADDDDDEYPAPATEAVVVRFLGRYDLIRTF